MPMGLLLCRNHTLRSNTELTRALESNIITNIRISGVHPNGFLFLANFITNIFTSEY